MRKHLLELPVAITLFVLVLCSCNFAFARENQKQVTSPIYAGTWNGVFDFNGTKLHLVLKISAGDTSGNYKASLDSPDQGAADLPVDSVTADGDNFAFVMSSIGASYKGKANSERTEITGDWKQGPVTVPVVFRREGAVSNSSLKRGALNLSGCNLAKIANNAAFCGKYEVFENRDSKAGRKIALNIMVLPALAAHPQPDPLFFIAGGPGQSAVSVAATVPDFLAEIRRDRDIVLVDQRGTGASNLLDCDFGRDRSDMTGYFRDGAVASTEALQKCRAELEKRADLSLYTTSIAMDDLDEVRAALGYDKINVYGGSYGTNAALVYLRRHGDRTRTAVLKGVAPTDYKLPLNFARGVQSAVERVFNDCAADVTCNKTYPNLEEKLDSIVSKLDAGPVTFRVINVVTNRVQEITLTKGAFLEGLRILLYSPEMAGLMPMLIHQASEGDFTTFAAYSYVLIRAIDPQLAKGMQLSVLCSEHVPFITEADIKRETTGTYYGDTRIRALQKACVQWNVAKAPASFIEPVRSNVPVLLISSEFDPVTPPVFAQSAARFLTNSKQVVVKNGSHLSESDCIDHMIAQFVSKGSWQDLVTTCAGTAGSTEFVYKLPRTLKPQ